MRITRTALVALITAAVAAAPASAFDGYDGTVPPVAAPQCQKPQLQWQSQAQQDPAARLSEDPAGGDQTQQQCPPYPGKAPLVQHIYRFAADVNDFSQGVLDVTINRPNGNGVPAYVLVGDHVRVFDADGHRVSADALQDADSVAVSAKLLRFSSWMHDEDGDAVPTFRAKQIHIVA
jgi:hypothetical protein